ncbi:cytochrome C biosynthesis protein [Desulfobotulus sp. H1]|uniref:Cytochrome C biosynthesis protein n=1 Tax=Desulfobotulus pelophilus TaxID=2823377 RepID=A0ABT3NC38_9BACT|nr:cytochrome c biogenesis protein CcdA [Desulfobotulus pelophilus]MCW7755031.1 cytochrome C biosynthesis protein [Desulfobotulus pelophilus]
MLNEFFITLHHWMMGGFWIGAAASFIWGMVSVLLSPCHLASIPLIVGYVAGQDEKPKASKGVSYALSFTTGLFITIAVLGILATLLGRMMGEISPYWTILVGAILLWISLDMMGVQACSLSGGGTLSKLRVRGLSGAFILGLAYGILSGSCTFGFIAPILALMTLQETMASGLVFIVLFGIGHCLPIAIAGSSMALVRRLLESTFFQQGGFWFKKTAGAGIGLLALYFIARPFIADAPL